MGCFVIVHGAWGGGWEWAAVADALRAKGHSVFTPTLSGLGERAHLHAPVDLTTHIADVVAAVEFEDLRDVVLCGASYGGMAVTGAADRIADRIRLVVYVDALVPEDGESALDLLPPPFAEAVRSGLAEHGDGWRVPFPLALVDALLPEGALPPQSRQQYLDRLRDQPARSFADPIKLTGAVDDVARVFIRCTTGQLADAFDADPIARCAERARTAGWPYREFPAPHDPQLYDPLGIAALLDEVSR